MSIFYLRKPIASLNSLIISFIDLLTFANKEEEPETKIFAPILYNFAAFSMVIFPFQCYFCQYFLSNLLNLRLF